MATVSDESTDQLSDEDSESSCINSDLQELYESFDFQNDETPALESGSVVSPPFQFKDTSLYAKARLTLLQSCLLVFQCTIQHNLTTKAFTELLQLISVHILQGAAIPKSVYQLKRSVSRNRSSTPPLLCKLQYPVVNTGRV